LKGKESGRKGKRCLVPAICQTCGKQFHTAVWAPRKFCSLQCSWDWKRGKPNLNLRGAKHTEKYKKEQSLRAKELWQTPEYANKVVTGLKVAWADINSGMNSDKLHNETGFGHKSFSSDGHRCDSNFELIFEEWLIVHSLIHIPHPQLPRAPHKRADQLVNGHYIEIDGMRRTNSYWEEKYEKTNIHPIIIKAEELTHILNGNLLRALEGKN